MADYIRARLDTEIDSEIARAVVYGLRRDAVRGTDGAGVAAAAARQGVRRIPAAVQSIWSFLGADPGPFWMGDTTEVGALGSEARALTTRVFASESGSLVDLAGALVLLVHGTDECHLIDGADLDEPNPPVWLLQTGRPAERMWPTTVEWLKKAVDDVIGLKRILDDVVGQGGDSTVSRYFT